MGRQGAGDRVGAGPNRESAEGDEHPDAGEDGGAGGEIVRGTRRERRDGSGDEGAAAVEPGGGGGEGASVEWGADGEGDGGDENGGDQSDAYTDDARTVEADDAGEEGGASESGGGERGRRVARRDGRGLGAIEVLSLNKMDLTVIFNVEEWSGVFLAIVC